MPAPGNQEPAVALSVARTQEAVAAEIVVDAVPVTPVEPAEPVGQRADTLVAGLRAADSILAEILELAAGARVEPMRVALLLLALWLEATVPPAGHQQCLNWCKLALS